MARLFKLSDILRFGLVRARRMRRDESGAAAVEFALIAVPFFLILFAIIEVSLVFFANQILDNAVSDAARMIRTGQAQKAGFSSTEFKNQVCGGLAGLFDCGGGKLHIDVKTYTKFADVSVTSPIDDDDNLQPAGFGYDDGGPETIVVASVYYEWPLVSGYIRTGFGNLANGNRLLASVVTFRNEPFPE